MQEPIDIDKMLRAAQERARVVRLNSAELVRAQNRLEYLRSQVGIVRRAAVAAADHLHRVETEIEALTTSIPKLESYLERRGGDPEILQQMEKLLKRLDHLNSLNAAARKEAESATSATLQMPTTP